MIIDEVKDLDIRSSTDDTLHEFWLFFIVTVL